MADADLTETQVHSRHFTRVMPLIVALERIERPTVANLALGTGLTERELESRVQCLQRHYQVVIERSLQDGCLVVKNWGIIDRAKSSRSKEV
jgi:hypothetical protein